MKVTKYGLWHKKEKKVLGFYTRSNKGADFCGDTTHELCLSNEKMWLVDNPYQAEYVRNFSTPWYNAGYETPENEFEPEEMEVVKVEITTDITPEQVTVPTLEKCLELIYKEKDPTYYNYVLGELKKHPQSFANYSWYDLWDLMNKGLWPEESK